MSNHSLSASVAMCTYNGERFLEKQLHSFAAQTVLPGELVVCDDGSMDGTPTILENFRRTASFPVRIFRNETNLGYVKNFEKAALLCGGDIIFFSDQDDIWLPEKIEKTLAVFSREPNVGLVLLRSTHVDENDMPVRKRRDRKLESSAKWDAEPYSVEKSLRRWILSWQGCNMAYRNSLREVIYPVNSRLGHDQWILLLLGAVSDVRFLRTPTAYHRLHTENHSRQSLRTRNLFRRAWRSLRRHQDPALYAERAGLFRKLAARAETVPEKPWTRATLAVFSRFEKHLDCRAEAIRHVFRRPGIIFSETVNGNYFFCSKGVKDILSDLLAWPRR